MYTPSYNNVSAECVPTDGERMDRVFSIPRFYASKNPSFMQI